LKALTYEKSKKKKIHLKIKEALESERRRYGGSRQITENICIFKCYRSREELPRYCTNVNQCKVLMFTPARFYYISSEIKIS
jgi:hypothetical protein